ncbi:hypothetical protein AB1Y20_011508 [Prymnesium parvum]|uniref:ABC transporter domain-containing protein n=1 Tax=Prymnesium parvum TaxID=97485 RepID=A0AB34IHD3_PRYPA
MMMLLLSGATPLAALSCDACDVNASLTGFTCRDPALPLELCPVGRYCTTATFDDGIPCQEATITDNYPRLYCEEGSKSYSVCPGGYICPNTTTKIQCAAGTFCAQGTNSTFECLSEWFQSAESRCPAGSSKEPARYDSVVITILAIVILVLVVESIVWCAGKFQEKQRERAELLHLEIKDMSFNIGKATVLSRLKAEFYQGELCGLMGESGSGKTTLLNVLGGRALYGKIQGRVNLNRRRYEPERIKLGFVPQAYLIFKELTVWENLWYAARHRVSLKTATTEAINELVMTVVELLGLTEVAHVVCDKNIGTHRLSGGQLRRVGIGIELVALPTVLLLDEPTSALDAVNTQLIMQVLQSLAARGVLVVASLHQPRFTVYELLDRLLVLRAGELIYAGQRSYTLDYLDMLGFVPAPHENPADFFIEVAL